MTVPEGEATSRDAARPRTRDLPIYRQLRVSKSAPAHASSTITFARRMTRWIKELLIVVVSALVLSLIIKSFFFQSFWIPSSSMETTLDVGDRILVTKWRPGPLELRHGDIVVFRDPADWLDKAELPPAAPPTWLDETLVFLGLRPEDAGEHLVKRVIGLPGDTVVCCDSEGYLLVNGERLVEPYLDAGIAPSTQEFSVTVPEGRLWVMGDNRPFSRDSRAHLGEPGGGTIPWDSVVGTAFAVVWPLDHWTGLGNPFEGSEGAAGN